MIGRSNSLVKESDLPNLGVIQNGLTVTGTILSTYVDMQMYLLPEKNGIIPIADLGYVTGPVRTLEGYRAINSGLYRDVSISWSSVKSVFNKILGADIISKMPDGDYIFTGFGTGGVNSFPYSTSVTISNGKISNTNTISGFGYEGQTTITMYICGVYKQ